MIRTLFLTTLCFLTLLLSVQGKPGDLDSTFGNGGKVTYRFNAATDTFDAVSIQPDGKIVVAGINGGNQMIILRYNTDGSLDTSFANNGIRAWNLNSYTNISDLEIQDDGKLVISGYYRVTSSNEAFLIIRLNNDGSNDNSFGNNGVVITDLTSGTDVAVEIIIQTDGKILATGPTKFSENTFGNIGVVRYNTDGTLDTSFNGTGIVITAFQNKTEQSASIELQPDGKILVAGRSYDNNTTLNSLVIYRYLSNGSLDNGFGNNGVSSLTYSGFDGPKGVHLGIQDDGKIIATTAIGNMISFEYKFTIYGFLPNGMLDTSFGNNGKTEIISGVSNTATSLEIQPDGKIVAVGHANLNNNGLDIVVARFHRSGLPDLTFGNGGLVITQVGESPRSDYGFDVALQSDGKIVVVGDYNVGGLFDYDAVLLRYLGDDVKSQSNTFFDYDGDGKSDISVFRPSSGSWYISNSSNGAFSGAAFGTSTDITVPADYDGDGKTDIAVFRPSNGTWYLQQSKNGFKGVAFGQTGDLPVPADYDGDGKADIAVYRPSTGSWYRLNSSDNQFVGVQFGAAEDKPTLGDFDGDGKADIAVFRPSNGAWYRLNSSDNSFLGTLFGFGTDKPVPADYDGDGKTDIAVYRASDGGWYRINSSDNSFAGTIFGASEDKPVPADYDGDGKADVAVFRPSNGIWYLQQSTNGFSAAAFGTSEDIPTPNAFVR